MMCNDFGLGKGKTQTKRHMCTDELCLSRVVCASATAWEGPVSPSFLCYKSLFCDNLGQ